MAIHPPSLEILAQISEHFGFELDDAELSAFADAARPVLDGYRRLDELAEPQLGVKYPRRDPGRRPSGADNPCHGWTWKCSIPGADSGPLAGRTVAVKDNVCLAGIPMLNGSPIMEGYVPREDATVVTRLLDAGAEIIGKTAVPAFCFDGAGVTGYPDPQPVNPHDPQHLPGASSAGSGAVVANAEVDMALGGDQGGSIRLPASWSGCCGLKATHGLVPYTGIFPIEITLDHVGPMARTVEDCAAMLNAIAGPDGLDPRQMGVKVHDDYGRNLDADLKGLRIGLLAEGFGIPGKSESDVDDAVRATAHALTKAGATVEEISVPMHRDAMSIWNAIALEGSTYQMVTGDAMGSNWQGHYSTDLLDFYGRARRARAQDFSETVKLTALAGYYLSEHYNHHYYAKAQNLRRVLRARYDEALERCDVMVLPTTPMKAVRRPEDPDLATLLGTALGNIINTAPFDVSGHPAMSVPCGMSEGLPVGFMIVGRRWDEHTVLRVAAGCQAQTG
ncbi:MAG TPA: amidase [Gammaproteobacteria bacterium]|nr:amidase [Gammaproteobacteria bacterium]